MALLTMYDAWSAAALPADAQIVAGYLRGGDYDAMVARFPHARHVGISTSAEVAGDVLDIENGDAVPYQAPGWVQWRIDHGVYRPALYASIEGYMPAVVGYLHHAGISLAKVRLVVAHWTPGQKPTEVPAGYDGVQWWNNKAAGWDESLLLPNFFDGPPPEDPTLTAAQKTGLRDTIVDLGGIVAYDRPLTPVMMDQLRLGKKRIADIPGV
jgi:hypothetical protein